MRLNLNTLHRAIERSRRPDPPDAVMANGVDWGLALLRRYGYSDCPASLAVARHAAHVRLAEKSDAHDPGCDFGWGPPKRGLALFGTVGTGKTTAMRILAAAFRWPITSLADMSLRYAAEGNDWLDARLDEWRGQCVVLDDLGSEGDDRHFGSALPVVAILSQRYEAWSLSGVRTYLTSNLSREERVALYGARIEDRAVEMCEAVKCCWGSFRKGGAS